MSYTPAPTHSTVQTGQRRPLRRRHRAVAAFAAALAMSTTTLATTTTSATAENSAWSDSGNRKDRDQPATQATTRSVVSVSGARRDQGTDMGTVRGLVRPAAPGRVVRLQRAHADAWVSTRRAARTRPDGRYVIRVPAPTGRPAHRVVYRVVVMKAGARGFDASEPFTVTVAPAPDTTDGGNGGSGASDGFLLGAAHGANTVPTDLERDAGVPLGIRRTYYTADGVEKAAATAAVDVAAGRVPFVSFKLPYTWAEMAAGKGDAWARHAAERLAAVPGEVWVVLHHEPEHDEPQIRDWTRLQQRLSPFFDVDGIQFGLCVTGWNQFFGETQYAFENIYPFGAPIDFVALDPYQWYGTPKNETKWTDLDDYYERMEAFAGRVDVEWGLAEFGITDAGFATAKGRTFFEDTVASVSAHGGSFAAYFDTELNSYGNSWVLRGEKRAAFVRTVKALAQ